MSVKTQGHILHSIGAIFWLTLWLLPFEQISVVLKYNHPQQARSAHPAEHSCPSPGPELSLHLASPFYSTDASFRHEFYFSYNQSISTKVILLASLVIRPIHKKGFTSDRLICITLLNETKFILTRNENISPVSRTRLFIFAFLL